MDWTRLRRRFIFMGILNAIFAPLIVSYLIMYSFFRYFEVSSSFFFLLISKDKPRMCRSIVKILQQLADEDTHLMLSGNSVNSTSYIISLYGV